MRETARTGRPRDATRRFAAVIRACLAERNRTVRAALDAGLPQDAVQRVLDGHPPRAGRLAAICEAVGLEFYVGPPHASIAPTEVRATARYRR